MPLNPSPITVRTLQGIQGEIEVQRYACDDPDRYSQDRAVVLCDSDSGESITLSRQEELYELAQALLDQVVWLSNNEPDGEPIETPAAPADWVVVRQGTEASGGLLEIIGPMTQEACTPEWWDAPGVAWITSAPLERPPLV